jgi:hypothetical protein
MADGAVFGPPRSFLGENMKVQALKTLLDGNEYTRKGAIVEMDQWRAHELIALGYVVHIPEPEESVAAPIAFLAANDNKDERVDPFMAPRNGGLDGLEKPASLSQEGQARPRRTYKRREADTKS